MRLFLAIPLANFVVDELSRFTAPLRSTSASLRWSAPESWHITLQFLGNTTPEQYDCLLVRLAELRCAPVPIQLAAPGIFDRAVIFHVGVELTSQLVLLQTRIGAVAAPCGFEPESRPYYPHITLARAKAGSRAGEPRNLLAGIPAPAKFSRFSAEEFLLYESHLSSAGSRYEVRQRFRLADAL